MAEGYSTPKRNLLSQRGCTENRAKITKKRSRTSPSNLFNTCVRCDNEINTGSAFLECNGCKLNFCLRCTGLSRSVYNCISSGELDEFQWACTSCKTTAPTLENINSVLMDIKCQQETRMTHIEDRMDRLEIRNTEHIDNHLTQSKKEIISELKKDINKLVDDRSNEMSDRKSREPNLVVFNLEEGNSDTNEINKEHDIVAMKEIVNKLGLENLEIITLFRLGKKKTVKTTKEYLKSS